MTLAADVIKTCGNLRNSGEAADILLAYGLATGLPIGDEIEWSDLPLGAGADLVRFANSAAYIDMPRRRSYDDIARAWLDWRLSHFGARMEPAPATSFSSKRFVVTYRMPFHEIRQLTVEAIDADDAKDRVVEITGVNHNSIQTTEEIG